MQTTNKLSANQSANKTPLFPSNQSIKLPNNQLIPSHPLPAVYSIYHPLPDVPPSVADPDPKHLQHFAGSGSIIFSMDTDPDPDPYHNLAHFRHPSPPPSHLFFHPVSLNQPPSTIIPHHLKQFWIRISMKSGIRIRIRIKTFWIHLTGWNPVTFCLILHAYHPFPWCCTSLTLTWCCTPVTLFLEVAQCTPIRLYLRLDHYHPLLENPLPEVAPLSPFIWGCTHMKLYCRLYPDHPLLEVLPRSPFTWSTHGPMFSVLGNLQVFES